MNLLEIFVSLNIGRIDKDGISPMQAVARCQSGLHAISLAGHPRDTINHLGTFLHRECCHEFVFGLDSFTRPGQGTELDSAIIVFHGQAGEGVRVGVLEYQWSPDGAQTKPINWGNEFWSRRYAKLAQRMETWLSDQKKEVFR